MTDVDREVDGPGEESSKENLSTCFSAESVVFEWVGYQVGRLKERGRGEFGY